MSPTVGMFANFRQNTALSALMFLIIGSLTSHSVRSCSFVQAPTDCDHNVTYTYKKGVSTPLALTCMPALPADCGQVDAMRWTFQGQAISGVDPRYTFHMEKAVLVINKPNKRHAGVYTVTYTINSSTVECRVCVLASPLVLKVESANGYYDRVFTEGEDCDLGAMFEVLGYPPATVTWARDGSRLVESDDVTITDDKGHKSASLKIKNLTKSMTGIYALKASSSYFKESSCKSLEIWVKIKNDWVFPLVYIALELALLPILMVCNATMKKWKQKRQEKNVSKRTEKYKYERGHAELSPELSQGLAFLNETPLDSSPESQGMSPRKMDSHRTGSTLI